MPPVFLPYAVCSFALVGRLFCRVNDCDSIPLLDGLVAVIQRGCGRSRLFQSSRGYREGDYQFAETRCPGDARGSLLEVNDSDKHCVSTDWARSRHRMLRTVMSE